MASILDKMCVPDLLYRACTELVESTKSEFASIRCVAARDRMECLEKVNKREADFLAVDPEDMYVAFRMKNEDFSLFSELRTVLEPDGRCLNNLQLSGVVKTLNVDFSQLNSVTRESFWCTKTLTFAVWPICVARNRVTPATVVMSATKFPSPN